AVLFSRGIEFKRTHDLAELTALLNHKGVETPIAETLLLCLNPYAVIFRYDEIDVELVSLQDAFKWTVDIRTWAEQLVSKAEAEDDLRSR
ncbi:MAG TPA: HEPN domain-containing protein, partial [bacterium]|nr:HEPN domain-containing protein [bacterium]